MTDEKYLVTEQEDLLGNKTGVEAEKQSSDEKEIIVKPFDPEDIDVTTRTMTVDLLLSRLKSDMIDLQPDFQRRWGVWNKQRQSRLIESLLLRIPLPVLYAAEDEDERWEIVDGIQRLSTISRFISPEILGVEPMTLSGLEYLHLYDGKRFPELSPRLQLRLRETELVIHLIRKGTPAAVKYNIFARINTGGSPLSRQELRHAITPGQSRLVLETLAESSEFKRATSYSVKSTRMDDREMVLRYIAFRILGWKNYDQPNMDGFLIRAMHTVNDSSELEIERLSLEFYKSMDIAYEVFGNDAFRKRYYPNATRLPINKALFEAISVNLAKADEAQIERIIERKEEVRLAVMELCNDRRFEESISQATGGISNVKRRFGRVAEMLEEVAYND